MKKENGPALYDLILSETIDFIQNVVEDDNTIEAHSSLVKDLDFDSVEIMELIEDFEDKYEIEIPIARLPELETVEDLVRLVCPLIQQKLR